MKILFGLFVLFCNTNIYNVLSQKTYSGLCQQFGKTQFAGFNKFRYMGFWYIHSVYDYSNVAGKDCLTSNYIGDGRLFKQAKIEERSKNLKTNEHSRIDSLMVLERPFKGHYTYQIPDQQIDDWSVDILDTDYDNYSIEWSCLPDGSNSGCYIWIMSRHQSIDCEFWEKVDPILQRHKISKENLRTVVQDDKHCSDKTLY